MYELYTLWRGICLAWVCSNVLLMEEACGRWLSAVFSGALCYAESVGVVVNSCHVDRGSVCLFMWSITFGSVWWLLALELMFMDDACSSTGNRALLCWLRFSSLAGAFLWRICVKPVTSLVTLTPLVLVFAADDFGWCCRFMETLSIMLKTLVEDCMGWRHYQLAVGR